MISELSLERNPATLRHVVSKPAAHANVDNAGSDDLERRVLGALVRLLTEGKKVTRAGGSELWQHKPPELDGVGRNKIRTTVETLISDGMLVHEDGGVKVAE